MTSRQRRAKGRAAAQAGDKRNGDRIDEPRRQAERRTEERAAATSVAGDVKWVKRIPLG